MTYLKLLFDKVKILAENMQLCKSISRLRMTSPTFRPINDIISDLRAYKDRCNVTQIEMAIGAKVSQSDVQRALAGKKQRPIGNFLKICNYANVDVYSSSPQRDKVDPAYDRRIKECIAEIWDGSPQQGKVIVALLTALKAALR